MSETIDSLTGEVSQKNIADIINEARAADRISARDIIDKVFTDFFELHGDRQLTDDEAIVGGIARFNNQAVTVIGIQKGRNLAENLATNFGQPSPNGYRKALRLMKQAEKFGRPVITFINTAGAYPGIEAEERGQGEAIARNLLEMSDLKVPIIAFITGEGGSGGALALALANKVYILENAVYSVLSPEGFATILWKDGSRRDEAAELMKITAPHLLEMGLIDAVISEENLIDNLKRQLTESLSELSLLTETELAEQRYERFRKY
ncbi:MULTISPECIES: acetyl-CoA carboxylase carboxyl transferase subunit alpha [Lactococcus]|jgi:acetyl-CoA carboxylase carboxyl transferase subunit alpha|uniref:acetyl-CoA carboxylase carboxyl transferase subunit alpha n=1 Tax=Lactococcus TaxID=1357 RepID=UPI00024D91C5|nr:MULTISPECIES: acetyl-CoA carboxylase carboxyl transferase subunit alpha [Lactococcus]MCA2380557.1 acetyl-CoA carboxylase carboxyl transferase subunit alpha [Lactococcus sp. SK2-659]MCI2094702.1 acetyl-CoA carboxylase carboxyl transferase subunit alpha [Lactococcus lactis]MCI2139684.1 acetyl-CoA carboxylase carboxyl transferase subunit alpha [Lactococcus lactis]THA53996.1 acetyl-CoA carboxylase carboxyl transferase subunit alpha [Lactococcus lactis]BAL50712.1 AccA protein [Lactococcus lactis